MPIRATGEQRRCPEHTICSVLTLFHVASNFNNARRLVKKLEQIGIAGACIEDKLFPKTNSLLSDTEGKPLADIQVGVPRSPFAAGRSAV